MAMTIVSTVSVPMTSKLAFRSNVSTRAPFAAPSAPMPRRSGVLPRFTPTALFSKQKEKKRYDSQAFQTEPAQPAFTRRREVFVGRLAMMGFAASLIGEVLTGKGPIGQVSFESGLPTSAVELLFLGIVAWSFIGGLRPGSPTFSKENQEDIKKRPKGPAQTSKVDPISKPQEYFGTTTFGWSKKNEVFVGRTAQLGFLASVIGEKITGKGPLGQFGLETGVPVGQASLGLVIFISFFVVASLLEGNYGDSAIDENESY